MTVIITDPQERTRFLKFMVVGAFGALIDFGIANLLAHYINMPLVYAGSISFTCAVISNFIWNRYWTYPDSRSRQIHHQLAMFFAVNIVGILIRIPILKFGEPPLLTFFQNLNLSSSITPDFLARNFTLAIAVGIVMLWNFFVNRYWTYNDVS
jgi:putative flippase GtrA